MLAPYFRKALSTPTAYTCHSCKAYRRPSPSSTALAPHSVPLARGFCSQMLIFYLKVLPPGLKLSAKLHELKLLKNGGRTGEPACFHASCTLRSSVRTAPPRFLTPLCRDQCPLGQSSSETLYCTWLYPFSLLPGPFLLSPNYTVNLLGQVQSLSNYLPLPIFPQA